MRSIRLSLLALFAVLAARPVGATPVTADIAADTTWDAAGSPWQVMVSVSVNAGATLTVEPGAAVTFAQDTALTVEGTLLARGSSAAGITFSGTSSSPGWWYGLTIVGSGATRNSGSVLEYVTIEDGGGYYATSTSTPPTSPSATA